MNFQPNNLSEFQPNYMDAVNSLAGGKHTSCSSTGDVPTVWKEGATDLPTQEEIQTELIRLKRKKCTRICQKPSNRLSKQW